MLAVLFISLLVGCQSINVKYRDCGSQVGIIQSVSINPCTSDPCELQKGQTYEINVNFTSSEVSSTIHAQVYGTVYGVTVPFPLPQPNGCLDSGIDCPTKAGAQYSYKSSLPISYSYPSVSVLVQWELLDHASGGNKFICSQFQIKVVN